MQTQNFRRSVHIRGVRPPVLMLNCLKFCRQMHVRSLFGRDARFCPGVSDSGAALVVSAESAHVCLLLRNLDDDDDAVCVVHSLLVGTNFGFSGEISRKDIMNFW